VIDRIHLGGASVEFSGSAKHSSFNRSEARGFVVGSTKLSCFDLNFIFIE